MSLVLWVACGDSQQRGDRGGGGSQKDSGPETMRDAGQDSGPATSEVTCADLTCDRNATCDDTEGEPRCTCLPGYTGDGMRCTDIDECEEDNGGCDEHALCVNRPGSRRCVCEETFSGDGETCTGTDECSDSELNTCDPNATCSDEVEGFSCACNDGTTGDGFGCADVDECADEDLFECGANTTCKNTFGGYECECGPGFTGDATTCQSLCEATPCAGDRLCRVIDDAADCTAAACKPGFVGDGDTCTPIDSGDDCGQCDGQGDDDVRGAVCGGTAGSGACTCAPGFTGTFPDCVDEDECAADNGGCGDPDHFRCVNLPHGYACGCQPGWTGPTCAQDVDECTRTPGPCHPNATCTNTAGSFTCECKPGFTGDGSVCRDIDECADGDDNCLSDGTARCVNTLGAFACRCKRGYTGDGVKKCENIDECDYPNLNDCAELAICDDADPRENPVGYECTCPDGLIGDGTECSDVDECRNSALNECPENSTCVNKDAGYECECRAPFAGDDPNACYCDLSGYWAMRQDLHTCWCDRDLLDVTIISGGTFEATVWELHRYRYDGETLRVEKKGCGGDKDPDLVSPHFGETYSSYIPEDIFLDADLEPGRDVEQSGIVPGMMFTTPDEAILSGIDLGDDPLCKDCWPATFNEINETGGAAPSWVDDDEDGEPGLSLWPRPPSWQTQASTPNARVYYSYIPINLDASNTSRPTKRAGCVSVATRIITRLESDVRSCERIVGEVINVKTEGRVGSCTIVPPDQWDDDIRCDAEAWSEMDRCSPDELQRLDDQSQDQTSTATFELVKIGDLDDDIDCSDVRRALPVIDRTGPAPMSCDCP